MYLFVILLATLGACMNYTDYLGRNISLPLSAALYSPNPPRCLQKRLNATVMEGFLVHTEGGLASGLIATLDHNRTVALTFKVDVSDSYDFEDFDKLFVSLVKWRHEGKVSKFLARMFKNLWIERKMRKRFREVMKERSTHEVLITGHSLGGGVAALVAVDIVKKGLANKGQVTLITLGQTMVGDENFAKAYEKEVEYSYRVVRRGDFIPHYPGQHRGYEYNGKEVYYKRYDMRFNGSTGFEICERNNCSIKQVNPVKSINNDVYFKKNITEYGLRCK
ncbi:triacylglycerol lipase [Ancylostoma caninum]|uniref:Triacylglycerol lipase n=1 Tax=Ancylostoma caninum TaxID=29170 RepID=A0A368FLW7_ANCCA|nr:triacylglycerol lipase [Ancylostoma caninum]